jgi:tetratricopeptide (TPR) repeat protein
MAAPDSTHESAPDSLEGRSVETADLTNLPRPTGTQFEFSPGALIADRFRIVRFLGRGGMGEVYEALDLELSESVAIKTLRPEIARDETSLQRFRREIQIARKVTHPNVCRLYDFFQHGAGSSSILCLSMELLRGEPLSERLRRTGPLSVNEAMPIIEQMASGLTAAHRAGVVHRDFKSPNVILTTGRDGLRAVVTDFGLAQVERDDSATALTGPGAFLGTPLYVAPEQLQAGAITPATDVYAFGVVLFEMMTGHCPFHGSNGLETALLRLKVAPQSPRRLNPTLPRHWDAAILKCLSRKPSERFAFPDQVSLALAGNGRTLVARRQFIKYRMAASAILLLLILGGIGLWTYHSFRISPVAGKRLSICVVQPVSMDIGSAGRGTVSQITQLLTNDLETISSIRVVPHYRVAQAGIDGLIADRNELTPDVLRTIRAQMDSDYVVSGTYTSIRNKAAAVLRVDLKLYDTNTGEMTAAVSASGPENAPLELQNELSNRLRSKLGLRTIQKEDAEHLLVNIPPDPTAQKVYSDAVDRLQHYDSAAAVLLLKKVTEISPQFPLAHLDLAEAYANLGYDTLANEQSAQARRMLSGFSEEKKIYVEARSHELSREWKPAIELYKELIRSYSDNPEYWLRLALSQGSDGQNDEGLQTIAKARDLLHTQDPRFPLAETEIINRSGNFQKVFDASRRAVLAATQANATSIEAKAWIMQCWAALNLGRPAEARSDCAKGADLSESVHDQATHAKALNVTANALLKEGKSSEAELLYKQVFRILEGIGDEKNLGGAHLNYGNALLNRSDFAGAEREYRLSLAAAQKRQDKADIALATANIAGVLTVEGGRLPEAEGLYVDALALARSVGAEITAARCLNNLGYIQARRGDLDAAMASYTEALAKRTKLGSEDGRALILVEMGDLLTEQDDLQKAKLRYKDALAIQQRLEEREDVANTQMSLARVSLFEDGAPDELPALHAAITSLEGLSDKQSVALGYSLAARMLERAGNHKEALKEADQASHLLPPSADVSTRMEVQLNCAWVHAKDAARSERTIQTLEALLVQASKQSLLASQLRARLLLAELKGKNSIESRRMLLETVKTEAQAKGFRLIAREAQTAIPSAARSKH